MTAAPIVWDRVAREDLAIFLWRRGVRWPFPLDSSGVGRWEPSAEQMRARQQTSQAEPAVTGHEVWKLLATILRAPAYCAYVIRGERGVDSYHAAVGSGRDVVAVIDSGDAVWLAQIGDTQIAATLATHLPPVRELRTPGVRLSAHTAGQVEAAVAAGASPGSLRALLADAHVPLALAAGVLPSSAEVLATGSVGAVRYAPDGLWSSGCSASWTEAEDGAVLSTRDRAGELSWNAMSTGALAHAVADALAGLAS